MDHKQKLISLCDQVQATLEDVFKERGYDVEVDVPKLVTNGEEDGMKFTFNCRSKDGVEAEVDEATVKSVIQEAISRVGELDEFGGELRTSFDFEEEEEDKGDEWWKKQWRGGAQA